MQIEKNAKSSNKKKSGKKGGAKVNMQSVLCAELVPKPET
jgi:hypothetical protein